MRSKFQLNCALTAACFVLVLGDCRHPIALVGSAIIMGVMVYNTLAGRIAEQDTNEAHHQIRKNVP